MKARVGGDFINSLCPYDYVPCRQVIGSDASALGNDNFYQYSGNVEARGMDDGSGVCYPSTTTEVRQ
jgi:hypothetical protein